MKILEFYTGQLETLGFSIDNDYLRHSDDNSPAYFTYVKEKRRMALPTTEVIKADLKDPDGVECHAFHPMCESVLQGESGTIRFIKQAIKARLWLVSMNLIDNILAMQASGKSSRNASYKKFLSDICEDVKEPKFDDVLLSSWQVVKDYVAAEIERKKYITLFIASEMTIEGKKYIRAANYHHCFEEEGLDGTATYFGAKLKRKQDKVIIHRLLSEVFGWYPSVMGSNDNRPYYGCLIRGWAQYIINYNQIAKGLRDNTSLRPLSDEWIAQVDNMQQFDNVIRTLPYNTGPRKEDTQQDTTKYEYSLQQQSAATPRAAPSTSTPAGGLMDPMEFLRSKGLGQTTSYGSTQIDITKLTPVQQRQLREHGMLNNAGGSEIERISLVGAFGNAPQPGGFGATTTASGLLTGNSGASGLLMGATPSIFKF